MHLVAIAWLYVVLLMAVAEALSAQGTLLGAFFTLLLYGVLPLSIVLYVMGTPGRKRARKAAENALPASANQVLGAAPVAASVEQSPAAPDGSGQAAGDTVAAERKET